MGMSAASRTRWLLALALGVLALVAAAQAAGTYVAHGVTVGLLAVIALAVTVVVGLVSLGQARRRIGQELQALRATPAGGALLAERRQRLLAIQAAGVRPDRAALAEVAAADEAGRAYLGRYLVATTILIGLVGTFAGLMQTLGNVAPLLGQKDGDLLALLAAPLGGLQITFAASLVAILATLALALAQGDLALHEAQALALLEDRTTHELVPAAVARRRRSGRAHGARGAGAGQRAGHEPEGGLLPGAVRGAGAVAGGQRPAHGRQRPRRERTRRPGAEGHRRGGGAAGRPPGRDGRAADARAGRGAGQGGRADAGRGGCSGGASAGRGQRRRPSDEHRGRRRGQRDHRPPARR